MCACVRVGGGGLRGPRLSNCRRKSLGRHILIPSLRSECRAYRLPVGTSRGEHDGEGGHTRAAAGADYSTCTRLLSVASVYFYRGVWQLTQAAISTVLEL